MSHARRGEPRTSDLGGTGYCACFNTRKAARALTQLYDAALRPSALRATQFAILVAVAKTQPVSIGDLGEVTVIDRTTLTRSLRLMQRQRLLSVGPWAARRQRFVRLTRKGWRRLGRGLPLWRKIQGAFVEELGPRQWGFLQRELERVAGVALDLEESRSLGRSPPAPRRS